MIRRTTLVPSLAVLLFVMTAFAQEPSNPPVPAGDYRLDRAHASLIFKVDHLGFSMYTARFTDFDAELYFDPGELESSRLKAQVSARSLETDFPTPEQLDFNAMLLGEDWIAAEQHPEIHFVSTGVEKVGAKQMRVTGDFTLRGVTRPLTLDVRYNGGYAGHDMDPNARVGFSATGTLKRAEYGMNFGLPPEGSTMGVGNEVHVVIEAEFSGPAWQP